MFPADAGMILASLDADPEETRVPRGCGDDPIEPAQLVHELQCSPRMRG